MIQIELSKYGYSVSGHAYYAEKGTDIVCSAISALAQTGAHCVNKIVFAKIEIDMKEPRIIVNLAPDMTRTEPLQEAIKALDVIKTGFKLVAEAHPSYVKITEVKEHE